MERALLSFLHVPCAGGYGVTSSGAGIDGASPLNITPTRIGPNPFFLCWHWYLSDMEDRAQACFILTQCILFLHSSQGAHEKIGGKLGNNLLYYYLAPSFIPVRVRGDIASSAMLIGSFEAYCSGSITLIGSFEAYCWVVLRRYVLLRHIVITFTMNNNAMSLLKPFVAHQKLTGLAPDSDRLGLGLAKCGNHR